MCRLGGQGCLASYDWRGTAMTGQNPHKNDRYVPLATGKIGGWGVWDRKLKRFISDEELERIPLENIKNEKWNES